MAYTHRKAQRLLATVAGGISATAALASCVAAQEVTPEAFTAEVANRPDAVREDERDPQ